MYSNTLKFIEIYCFLCQLPQQEMTYLNYLGFAFRVTKNLPTSYMLLPPSPHEKGKALGTRLGQPSVCKQNSGLYVFFRRRRNRKPTLFIVIAENNS